MKGKKIIKKIMITLLIILLVLVVVVCGGFAYLYFNGLSGMSKTTDAQEGQIKVACVGDSITYGHGIANWPDNNYPTVLQNMLGDAYHVNSYGVSGSAVQADSDQPYTIRPHYQEGIDYNADIVVFMMGSNDSKPENWKGAEAFTQELNALLDSYGDAEILLCTPATAFFLEGQTEGLTNYDIQPLIVEEIAQIVRDVAADRGCTLIDINSFTKDHAEWFAADGVHPSAEGAAAIAEEISKYIAD